MASSPPSIWRSPLVWISGMTFVFLIWGWHDSWQYFSKGVLLDAPYASRFVTSSGGRLAFCKGDLDPKTEFYTLTAKSGRIPYTARLWEELRSDMPLSAWPPLHWKISSGSFFSIQVYSLSWGFITFLHVTLCGSLIFTARRRIRKARQGVPGEAAAPKPPPPYRSKPPRSSMAPPPRP